MKFLKIICPLFLVSLLFQNCNDSVSPRACTDEFVMHSVTVLDASGNPADSVHLKVTNKDSEQVYPCGDYLCTTYPDGAYVIMHDGLWDNLSKSSDKITVDGKTDDLQFTADFIFSKGECHVQKVAGPDTVSLSPK